eukprot:gnl/TRDRNA2_/TRDRNA2_173507_c0_seq3.p1 gnl/TRDRNA2_/TRDRNA2_173507_c0~~gnl/TRDRNA2_/TRDRNA2_173507_c0_seq3.p1  ORF type:complete len:107 (-),score=9.84 gnl/TRDRNA2_/TRDRNA2_173507_c0_seq3:106-426(-)
MLAKHMRSLRPLCSPRNRLHEHSLSGHEVLRECMGVLATVLEHRLGLLVCSECRIETSHSRVGSETIILDQLEGMQGGEELAFSDGRAGFSVGHSIFTAAVEFLKQ